MITSFQTALKTIKRNNFSQRIEEIRTQCSEILENPQGKNYKTLTQFIIELQSLATEIKDEFPKLHDKIEEQISLNQEALLSIRSQQIKKTKNKREKSKAQIHTKDDFLEAAQNEELSFEVRVNALSEFLKLHKGALKASPAGIMTIQSKKILAITTSLIQNAQTTEQLTMLEPIIKRLNVTAINENFSAKMNSIQNVTTHAATQNTEHNVTPPKPLENTGQDETEDMNSQGPKSKEKSVTVFQKHLDEKIKNKANLLKSSFTNVDQHFDAIQNAMQTAISGLSKSRFLTDEKQKLLQSAKEAFGNSSTLENLQTFLAICQAHRSSAKHSLFGSSETHSFTAFKNALGEELKKQMLPEPETKPWFNIWGRKKND